jgi:glutaredoxin
MRAAIELFGSEWCPPCRKAKDIIKASNPEAKGVSFAYIDVGENPEYAMKSLPVIFVGDQQLEGPTAAQLRDALDKLYASVESETDASKDEQARKPQKPNAQWLVFGVFAALGFMGVRTFELD